MGQEENVLSAEEEERRMRVLAQTVRTYALVLLSGLVLVDNGLEMARPRGVLSSVAAAGMLACVRVRRGAGKA